ncbi:hypothetical protein HDU92_006664 [Lobulomyces angularis]|nr:hypothetical protein HDU92_006664 [Lobulomyces angularis]
MTSFVMDRKINLCIARAKFSSVIASLTAIFKDGIRDMELGDSRYISPHAHRNVRT